MKSSIKVKLVKSPIKCTVAQKLCVRGLGLRKLGSECTLKNTPAIRGMIKKVLHLVAVAE